MNNMTFGRSICYLHLRFLCSLIVVISCITGGRSSNMTLSGRAEKESRALLKFKQGLIDESNILSSWSMTNQRCCEWRGITCDDQTGPVTGIDLSYRGLAGKVDISPLLELLHLRFLYLTDFGYKNASKLPSSIDAWTQMESLDLGRVGFVGPIPRQLGNLSNLQDLDLSRNELLTVDSLDWLSGLSSLRYLDLSHLNLSEVVDWHISVSKLPSLLELSLEKCSLPDVNPSSLQLPFYNLSKSLQSLQLSYNPISSSIFLWIANVGANLLDLRLCECMLQSPIPDVFENMSGELTETHFSNLTRLLHLDVSNNPQLGLNLSSDWIPPFQLEYLDMSSCRVGPAFPNWLRTQRKLEWLSIAQSGIADSVPDWFSKLSSHIRHLNLSSNKIHGKFPHLSNNNIYGIIDLSSNELSGSVPPFPQSTIELILSKNKFSELPTASFCTTMASNLYRLDLSDNKLTGSLPDCFTQFGNLISLNLANNQLSGKLPSSLGNLINIRLLHLHNNNFSGEIPSLHKCQALALLDLGENGLSGKLPEWTGKTPKYLTVLRLRSNKFNGSVPTGFCKLEALQILDLSNNNLSGVLPNCLGNMAAMASNTDYLFYDHINMTANEYTNITWKGIEREFKRNLGLMKSIDISSNHHLSGAIPESITKLLKLKSLNLSRNNLSGIIPEDLGRLDDLEALDLSRNQLSGHIPPSFSILHFLSNLDLSYNKLEGKIPTSTQLQGFDASFYVGNKGLFGPPLTMDLPPTDQTAKDNPDVIEGSEVDGYITFGFYVSIAIGFIVGFWGFCGSLLLRRSWRHSIFRFWNNTRDWIYVTTRVFKARFLTRRTGSDN